MPIIRASVTGGNFSGILGIGNGGTGDSASRQIIQEKIVFAGEQTVVPATPIIPLDTTTPQNTEGSPLPLVIIITPKAANSWLHIKGRFYVSTQINQTITVALFQDAQQNALDATYITAGQTNSLNILELETWHFTGNTTQRTYKLRMGTGGGVVSYLNGNSSGAINLGGKIVSFLYVEEMNPATSSSIL